MQPAVEQLQEIAASHAAMSLEIEYDEDAGIITAEEAQFFNDMNQLQEIIDDLNEMQNKDNSESPKAPSCP